MNTRLLFATFLLCTTFVANGEHRIILTEENREVCPARRGTTWSHRYYAKPAGTDVDVRANQQFK